MTLEVITYKDSRGDNTYVVPRGDHVRCFSCRLAPEAWLGIIGYVHWVCITCCGMFYHGGHLPFAFEVSLRVYFDSDSAVLMCTPVPLCMYTCTWFQVLVQVCTTCRRVKHGSHFVFCLYAVLNFIDQIRPLYRECLERGSYQIFSSIGSPHS